MSPVLAVASNAARLCALLSATLGRTIPIEPEPFMNPVFAGAV